MDEPREIALLSSAQQALAEARTVDEVKDVRDKADAVRHYARQAKLGQELVIEAAVVKLRAERRIGQILRETPLATGVEGNQHDLSPGEPNGVLLQDLGISKSHSSRMQRIADLDDSAFEQYIATESELRREPTVAGVLRMIRSLHPVNTRTSDEQVSACRKVTSLEDIASSGLRFESILVNPLLTSVPCEQLEATPILNLLEDNGIVFVWSSVETLLETLDLADAWQLVYRGMQLFVPPKNQVPEQSMHLLLCFQRESALDTHSQNSSWIVCPQPEDEGIPQTVYRHIEMLQPGNALAIHTRSLPKRENWTVYGNQVQ